MKAFLKEKNTYNSSVQIKTLLILIFVPSDIILGMFMRISHNLYAGYVVPFFHSLNIETGCSVISLVIAMWHSNCAGVSLFV